MMFNLFRNIFIAFLAGLSCSPVSRIAVGTLAALLESVGIRRYLLGLLNLVCQVNLTMQIETNGLHKLNSSLNTIYCFPQIGSLFVLLSDCLLSSAARCRYRCRCFCRSRDIINKPLLCVSRKWARVAISVSFVIVLLMSNVWMFLYKIRSVNSQQSTVSRQQTRKDKIPRWSHK